MALREVKARRKQTSMYYYLVSYPYNIFKIYYIVIRHIINLMIFFLLFSFAFCNELSTWSIAIITPANDAVIGDTLPLSFQIISTVAEEVHLISDPEVNYGLFHHASCNLIHLDQTLVENSSQQRHRSSRMD